MTFRSTTRRGALVVALAGTLALTACSSDGNETAQNSTNAPVTSDGPVDATNAATQTTQEPLTAVEPADARAVFGEVYKNVLASRTESGDAAAAARAAAFYGPQVPVAEAEAKARAVNPDLPKPDAEAAKTPPVFLAVSTKASPHRLVVGEGQPNKSNLPELYLLESPDSVQNLKVTHVARMLPSRLLQKLQPPANGTPEVADTTPIGSTTPKAFLEAYVASVNYPQPEGATPSRGKDPYIDGVRDSAAKHAEELGDHGTYTVTNAIAADSTRVLQRQDGALMVFTHLRRTEHVAIKDGASVVAPAAVQAVKPEVKQITKEAAMQTDVCLVFYIYAGGSSELVAASEQLIDATGA